MSSTCGNCDCADKTQCPKKGNSYGAVIDAEKPRVEGPAMEAAHENGGPCKCGTGCSCGDSCSCGH